MITNNVYINTNYLIFFNKTEGIFDVQFTGDIYIKDILCLLESIQNYPGVLYPDIKVLLDFGMSLLKDNPEELEGLAKPILKISNSYNSCKFAKVVTTPGQVVYATLLKLDISHLTNIEIELFNIKKTALNWLRVK